jgi:hypothetical protein
MAILPGRWIGGIGPAATIITSLGFGGTLLAPTQTEAGVIVCFGFGFPIGFPGYYYPTYPYYPPPPPPYYAPPGYPSPASYQSSAGYPPADGYGLSGSYATPPITYTPGPGWTNAQGQYCREYKSAQGADRSGTERDGTACRDQNGQWRIVNRELIGTRSRSLHKGGDMGARLA